jgi:signal transduction histidine kinase
VLTVEEAGGQEAECGADPANEHARLLEAERSARLRLERLQAVTDIALAPLDLDDLLDVVLPRIRDILDADTCAVLLLDEETQELVARAAVGIEEEVERGVRIPLGKGFAGRVAADQRPVFLPDVDHADVLNPILREKGVKSLLGVPLLGKGESIGVLHVGKQSRRDFSQDDTELLRLVADRVARAIERAQLHEAVLRLDELRTNFVAIASHELRTPATAVYGAIATLVELGDSLPREQRRELLATAYEQGERLTQLLEQLLDLSRLDAKRIQVAPKALVLRTTLETIAAEAVPHGTPLRLEVAPDLAAVADPLALDRILSNLLANALRHGAPPIVISAEQRDTHLPSRSPITGAEFPRSCARASSSGSSPARTAAAASGSRSRARTPRRTAATSSTTTTARYRASSWSCRTSSAWSGGGTQPALPAVT